MGFTVNLREDKKRNRHHRIVQLNGASWGRVSDKSAMRRKYDFILEGSS